MTAEELREVLQYAPTTGVFVWKVRVNQNTKPGAVAGAINHGRRQISIKGTIYRAHRLAWLYVHGSWPTQHIDHIDGNPLNNRIANLRDVSRAVNLQNQRHASARNKSGLIGAMKNGDGYMARIQTNGKTKYLGQFATAFQAHEAYLKAKRELHEGCTI